MKPRKGKAVTDVVFTFCLPLRFFSSFILPPFCAHLPIVFTSFVFIYELIFLVIVISVVCFFSRTSSIIINPPTLLPSSHSPMSSISFPTQFCSARSLVTCKSSTCFFHYSSLLVVFILLSFYYFPSLALLPQMGFSGESVGWGFWSYSSSEHHVVYIYGV